jgi:CRP/FNR family cyclic AMP-dependent transcriptional regulator
LLRPDGLPESTDRRFLRAARALAPGEIPSWKEAVAAARDRLADEARRRAPGVEWPDRSGDLLRALIRRTGVPTEGALARASRLQDHAALRELDDAALFAAASTGELRRLAAGNFLYRAGDASGEISFVLQGSVALARATPMGNQPMGEAHAGDVVGEEALVASPRTADARAAGAVTLLGLPPDFFEPEPGRAAWLRYLRARLARRLVRLDDLFRHFFPEESPSAVTETLVEDEERSAQELSLAERSRHLGIVGLGESDRFLFAVFAEEKRYPAEAVIFREGEPGDSICVIAVGRVRISRRISGGEEALAILKPGEIFGEMAVLDPGRGRSADARAHEDAVVLELSRSRFDALERSDPEGCADLSALLCRLAARRAVETADRLASWRVLAGPA